MDEVKSSEISSEQLTKELETLASAEQEKVSKEILQRQEEERVKRLLTNPSALALATTRHESGENLGSIRKTVRQLFNLYLTNQFVARGVNVRADTIISRGYKILGNDATGVKACEELMDNSGGINLPKQLSINAYIAGDGFLEKVYNEKHNKILKLKHVHPLTLMFKTDESTGKIIVGPDKEPIGFVQYYVGSDGIEESDDVPKEVIAHLKFNTLGDEFTGLSLIQPGYDTIVRLMNMEYSAAEAAVKSANPLIVGECSTKSPHQIALWGQILGRITARDQIFIPEGMKIYFLSPGNQNFNEYAEYFLNAIVACFGVPKNVLLGGSDGGGNRAEGIILSRHFYSVIRGDQRYLSDFFNNIFKEYGEIAGFEPPKLVFEDVAEDASLLSKSAVELFTSGIIDRNEARQMIGLESKVEDVGVNLQGVSADMKKNDMDVKHPAEPGSPEGSQAGEKTKMEVSPYSEFKGEGIKNV